MSVAINDSSVISKGNAKSDYTMFYKTEFVTAKHNDNNISISYSVNQQSKSAMYNNIIYNATSLMIVQPAIHSFNGNKNIPGEVIIKHTSGSHNLNVCIPINSVPTNNSNSGSNIIAKIINAISSEAPIAGETAQGIDDHGHPRDRRHRPPRPHPVGPRPAENPLRKNHAPHPAQDRCERIGESG